MYIFINAINAAIVPWTYSKLRDRQYKSIAKVSNSLVMLIGIMTIGVMMVAPEIVACLGTEEYMEAIWVIPAVTFSVYFAFVYGLFVNVEFYCSATRFVMVASVVAAVTKVLTNAVFIPKFGYTAAGYTTLACYILLAFLHYAFMCRVCQKEMNVRNVFDVKSLVLVSLLMACAMLLCMVLYNNILLRFSAIIVALVILIILRKKVIAIVKQII